MVGQRRGGMRAVNRAAVVMPVARMMKSAWRAGKAAEFYLMPAAVHEALRWCLPRAFVSPTRGQLLTLLRESLVGSPPPPDQPALPAAALAAPALPAHDGSPLPPPPVPPGPTDPGAVATYQRYREAFWLPDDTAEQVAAKHRRFRDIAYDTRADRVRLLSEMARLAEYEGNVDVGILYRLRAMKLAGGDTRGHLPQVVRAMTARGYHHEAAAAAAMFGPPASRDEACARLIDAHRVRCRSPLTDPTEFPIYDDRRGAIEPRVSVIITLYNGANKLRAFLEALQSQAVNLAGRMELILVDSNSPADEYAAFRAVTLAHPIPSLFVRTTARESIQTAWNRGLGLARGPYVALLGVDETFTPPALADLADHLDADPGLDWVQADALVSEVDGSGAVTSDIMPYDRSGFSPDLVYLDTCYMGPVCALYRKSVHDRYGYYDGTYRAAGDTEFKNRVLPFIRTKYVNKMYGVYLNYVEERTTASPRAEIEDYRAWHLHRTAAGVRYAFGSRPTGDLERMLTSALRFRRSYCSHASCDFEYAAAVAQVLKERDPLSPYLALAAGTGRGLAALRSLDQLATSHPDAASGAADAARDTLAGVMAEHRATPWLPHAEYQVFNDARHEHHHWFW